MLFWLLALQLSLPQARCPDFTGEYIGSFDDGVMVFSIAQTRCERVSISWRHAHESALSVRTHRLALDGQFRQDSAWFGADGMQLTSAELTANRLELWQLPFDKSVPSKPALLLTKFQLLPDGDVCVTDNNTGKIQPPKRWGRLRGVDQKAIRAAATRSSGQECTAS